MGYRVRPERLPELVTALRRVGELIQDATPTQVEIATPGDEPVSIDAATLLGRDMSLRHYDANRAHRTAMETVLAKFGATATQYRASEENGTTMFGDK